MPCLCWVFFTAAHALLHTGRTLAGCRNATDARVRTAFCAAAGGGPFGLAAPSPARSAIAPGGESCDPCGEAAIEAPVERKWLDDFLALSLHRSFSRAADARHITQSALSRGIKMLEGWVGAGLIDRRDYLSYSPEIGQ